MTIHDQMAAEHPELDRYLFAQSVRYTIEQLTGGAG